MGCSFLASGAREKDGAWAVEEDGAGAAGDGARGRLSAREGDGAGAAGDGARGRLRA